MTRKLSVTAACNAANQRVGKPAKFGPNSWQVFFHEPDETASCAMQADDYFKAACYARELKAITAMELLADAHGYRAEYAPMAQPSTPQFCTNNRFLPCIPCRSSPAGC